MMKTTNFQKLPRTYLLFRTQSSPMPSSPSHPNLERISNFHHLTISTSNKSSRRIHLKVKLVFFNTKKKRFQIKNPWNFGEEKIPHSNGFFVGCFFLGRRWLRPWEVTEFLVLLGTTWTKALGVIDHPKLINSNTEYDTIIVHTYRIYTYSIHIYKTHILVIWCGLFYRRQIYAYTVWHQLAVSTISGPAPVHPSRPLRDSTVGKRENDSPENQSINQPINQTKDQPINQPTKQPTDQPTNQSSNLNFDTSILDSSLFSFHLLMDSGWLRLNTLHVSSHPRNLMRKRRTKNDCIKPHQIMAP